MRATMSAEGNLSCFELVGVPLEAIGTSRLVIEPMAITSIVQLDDRRLHFFISTIRVFNTINRPQQTLRTYRSVIHRTIILQ